MATGFLTNVLNHGIGNCKLAMTAIRLRNETITSDTAYWQDIWLDAYSTLAQCVDFPLSIGGYHHVGTRALRSLVLGLQIMKQVKANST